MPRKPRSDSASAAITAALAAASPLPDVPAHVRLRDGDRPFLDGILRARARSEWSAADLVVAAQLARCQADIETESERLDAEGSVIENQKGTPVMNPRQAVLQQLAQREMALMRALRMAGTAAGGDSRDLQKARSLQRQAEQAREELSSDDLLAT